MPYEFIPMLWSLLLFLGCWGLILVGHSIKEKSRLVLERPRTRLSFRLIVLWSYWAAALLLSFLILRLLPWGPELVSGPFLVAISVLAVAFWVPSLLVR